MSASVTYSSGDIHDTSALLESTVWLNDRYHMYFDGGLQKLTEHGR